MDQAPCWLKHPNCGLVSLMMACVWYVFSVCEQTNLDMWIQHCLWLCLMYITVSWCTSGTKWQPLPSLSSDVFCQNSVQQRRASCFPPKSHTENWKCTLEYFHTLEIFNQCTSVAVRRRKWAQMSFMWLDSERIEMVFDRKVRPYFGTLYLVLLYVQQFSANLWPKPHMFSVNEKSTQWCSSNNSSFDYLSVGAGSLPIWNTRL